MNLDQQIEVMTAFRDGAEIEKIKNNRNLGPESKWQTSTNPQWNWAIHSYRIKEKPKTVVIYYIEHLSGSLAGRVDIQTNDRAAREIPSQFRVIKTESVEIGK